MILHKGDLVFYLGLWGIRYAVVSATVSNRVLVPVWVTGLFGGRDAIEIQADKIISVASGHNVLDRTSGV